MKEYLQNFWPILALMALICCLAICRCHDVTPSETKDSLPAYWRRDSSFDWWSRLRNSDKHKNAIKDPIE